VFKMKFLVYGFRQTNVIALWRFSFFLFFVRDFLGVSLSFFFFSFFFVFEERDWRLDR